MKLRSGTKIALLLACGGAAGLAGGAAAQPTVINGAGATLLENFFRSRASTVDYIDVDGDGISRSAIPSTNDQLAPFYLPGSATTPNWPANQWWITQYSVIGSANGFQELINWGRTFATNSSTASPNQNPFYPGAISGDRGMLATRRTAAYYSRYRFINNGVGFNDATFPDQAGVGVILNPANPFGSPVRTIVNFNDWPANTVPNTTDAFRAQWAPVGTASTAPHTLTAMTAQNETASDVTVGAGSGLTRIAGMTVDFSPLDVPTTWAVTQTGTPNTGALPLQPGYGNNGQVSRNKQGGTGPLPGLPEERLTAGNQGNKLATLSGGAQLYSGTGQGDANTIFDNLFAFAPITPVTNFGTGIQQATMTDLQHPFATGRAVNGENIVVVVRDSGSGTRNGFQNSIGLDPSWGAGDNVGTRSAFQLNDQLGPAFQSGSKNGNGNVESTVINHRLGIGYVGPERGVEQGWLTNGRMEIIGVKADVGPLSGTEFARPTIQSICFNGDDNGWFIGGPAVIATFGDPQSAPAVKGGLGWMEPFQDLNSNGVYDLGEPFRDINGNSVRDAVETRPAAPDLRFPMRNVEAAAYVNNITRSIAAFENLPGSDSTLFTPGELAATIFVLPQAMERYPADLDPTAWGANPAGLNTSLRDFTAGSTSGIPNNVLGRFVFARFGNATQPVSPDQAAAAAADASFVGAQPQFRAGRVPVRTIPASTSPGTSVTLPDYRYSDDAAVIAAGGARGTRFVTEGGALLIYGNAMPLRNLVAGDFDGNGRRNIDDVADMMAAYRKRHEGGSWSAPAGSGDLAALSALISTGSTVGVDFFPVPGADFSMEASSDFNGDGAFDRYDIRYWADGLAIATTGPKAGKLDRAEGFRRVDLAYQAAGGGTSNFFQTVLATGKPYAAGDSRGDVAQSGTFNTARDIARHTIGFQPNGADGYDDNEFTPAQNVYGPFNPAIWDADDNRIDDSDIDYVYRNFKTSGVSGGEANWADLGDAVLMDLSADINGDLLINQADVDDLVKNILGTCYGDVNLDGKVSIPERALVIANVDSATPPVARWSSGDIDGDRLFTANDRLMTCPADFNCDGVVSVQDIYDFLARWNSDIMLPCPSTSIKSDINDDGCATVQDIYDFLAHWNAILNDPQRCAGTAN